MPHTHWAQCQHERRTDIPQHTETEDKRDMVNTQDLKCKGQFEVNVVKLGGGYYELTKDALGQGLRQRLDSMSVSRCSESG